MVFADNVVLQVHMDPIATHDEFLASASAISDDWELIDVHQPSISPASASFSPPSAPSHFRGSYRRFSWSFKAYSVQVALALKSVPAAARSLGVKRQSLENWVQRKGFDPDRGVHLSRLTRRGAKPKLPPDVEKEIADIVRLIRSRNGTRGRRRVSMRLLRMVAIGVAARHGICLSGTQAWLKNFCLRQGFRYLKRKNSVTSAMAASAADVQKYLDRLLVLARQHSFGSVDIISCDEFAVVFDSDLSKTIVDMATMDRDVDAVAKNETHVTALCAANAAGEWEAVMLIFQGSGKKVPPVEVSSSFRSRCLIRYTASGFISADLYAEFVDTVMRDHDGRHCLWSHDALRSVHCSPIVEAAFHRHSTHVVVVPAYLTRLLGALDLRAFAVLQTELIIKYDVWAISVSERLSAPLWRNAVSHLFFEARAAVESEQIRQGFVLAALIPDPKTGAFQQLRLRQDQVINPPSRPTPTPSSICEHALTLAASPLSASSGSSASSSSVLSASTSSVSSRPFPSSPSSPTKARSRSRRSRSRGPSEKRHDHAARSLSPEQPSVSAPRRRSTRRTSMPEDAVRAAAAEAELEERLLEEERALHL